MTLNEFLSKAGDLFKSNPEAATAELTSQLTAAQTEVTTLKAQLEAKDGELSKTAKEVVDLKASLEKANTDHVAALEAKEKDVESRANAKAIEFAAAQGIKPLGADKPKDGVKQISRAEFEAMQHSERGSFIKNGGKIKE